MLIVVFERFTAPARRVVVVAQEFAREGRRRQIGTHHLLLALAHTIGTDSSQALAQVGIAEGELKARADKFGRRGRRPSAGHIRFAPTAKRVVLAALDQADMRGDSHVRTADLLLAVAAERAGEGSKILADLGVDYEAIRLALEPAIRQPWDVRQDRDLLRRYHALAAERESVNMYRSLHAANPAPFRNDYVKALESLLILLDDLNLNADARQARQELAALAGEIE